jgi:tripartite-type tricarboxylate transporter receptor subunit TctC
MTKRAVLAKLSRRDFVTGAAMSVATSAMGWRLAQAQAAFPSRLITVISPFAPGGLNDICSRAVAKGLQEGFRQTVVVENRPGGNTLIALEQVARSAPDGHMLITVSDLNMTFLPTLASKLSFSIERDFAPVTLLCVVPFLLLVRAGLDVNSAGDVIALAKGSPGKLSFASAGATSGPRMAGELFKLSSGISMTHVPYRGAALAITDVMAGHVDLMFADMGSAASLVKAGKVRAIGISVDQRAAAFPELPPISQTGLPGFDAKLWIGVCVRAGTSPDIVQMLNREIIASLDRPEVAGAILSQGVEITTNSPDEFARMIVADRARFAQVIRATGIKLDE